jgi:glutathionyl-hydroquinone reductase
MNDYPFWSLWSFRHRGCPFKLHQLVERKLLSLISRIDLVLVPKHAEEGNGVTTLDQEESMDAMAKEGLLCRQWWIDQISKQQ